MNRDDILKEFGITEVAQITIPAEDMADEIVHLRRQLARKDARITWLENELDHDSQVLSAATSYHWSQNDGTRSLLFRAVKQYWENSLDDDGLDP